MCIYTPIQSHHGEKQNYPDINSTYKASVGKKTIHNYIIQDKLSTILPKQPISMPASMKHPQVVHADTTRMGKWSDFNGVEADKLGTCSVTAIANEEGFLLSNTSSDGFREIPAAESLCALYNGNKALFGNKPVNVWTVYEQENAVKGRSIRSVMQRIRPARIFEQVYSGESFMNRPSEEGARFCLKLVGGTVMATMRRQDGGGSPIPLSGDGSTVVCR